MSANQYFIITYPYNYHATRGSYVEYDNNESINWPYIG